MRLLLILAAAVTIPAYPLAKGCFDGFVALIDTVEPDESLIAMTFEQLLASPAASRMTLSTLEKLAASNDPFTLPKQKDAELDGLQKNLKDFERLLEIKGWNNPAIKELLVKRAAALWESRSTAAQRIDKAIEEAWSNYTVDLQADNGMTNTPDGKVATASGWANRPAIWRYFDPESRKTWDIPVPGHFEGGPPVPFFLHGGKEALIEYASRYVWRVPLVGGKPDWTNKVEIPAPAGSNLWIAFHQGKSPNFVYVDAEGSKAILRLDLRTNRFLKLATAGILGAKDNLADWGTVPGSDDLFLLVHKEGVARLHLVRADEKGELTNVAPGPSWSSTTPFMGLPQKIRWSTDGKTAYVSDFVAVPKMESFAYGQTSSQPLPAVSKIASNDIPTFHQVTVGPNGDFGAFVVQRSGGNNVGHSVTLFDQKTGQEMGSIPVPESTNGLLFTADGSRLLVYLRSGSVTVVNLEKYRSP